VEQLSFTVTHINNALLLPTMLVVKIEQSVECVCVSVFRQ